MSIAKPSASTGEAKNVWLFWTCFIALIATSSSFISRAFMLGEWGAAFNLSETQLGEIFGAGLYPFAISIIVFSLVVDKIGYGRSLWFAFACHLISIVLTIFATGYNSLYLAAFISALGNGTVEAVINPVIATIYNKEKTKWLNILHAGWPGGLMLAGIFTIALGPEVSWKIKVALPLVPVIVYGFMLLRCRFPVSERVAAGISYKEMLAEAGGVGIFIPLFFILQELGRVLGGGGWRFSLANPTFTVLLVVCLAVSIWYWKFTKSLGRPLYILMLVVMMLLATTEVGTDGWIKELMAPAMELIGLDAGWILVYTATIMTILRFLIGPILKITRFTPLGLLALSSLMVIIGIVWLSKINTAAGLAILVAATIYGAGQCFFWPTTLGFISERFPAGGALTINAIAGVGMLGVGILGMPWLGYIQNSTIENTLAEERGLFEQVAGEPMESMFGTYKPIDNKKVAAVTPLVEGAESMERQLKDAGAIPQLDTQYVALISKPEYQREKTLRAKLKDVRREGKSQALFKVAILPLLMLITYLALQFWFKSKGGYKPIDLAEAEAKSTAEA